jgi:hypothetical protein
MDTPANGSNPCLQFARIPGAPIDQSIRATFQFFSSFEEDARDFAAFAETRLPMPVLVLTGEKASGTFLIDQARLVATNCAQCGRKGRRALADGRAPEQVFA